MKINYRRVVLGGLLAGLVLAIGENILENLIFSNILGIGNERERLRCSILTRDVGISEITSFSSR